MAHRRFVLWLFKDRLFVQLKLANELWYYSRNDGSGEKQVSMFFVGWYEREGSRARLLTINALWLSIQAGFLLGAKETSNDKPT